MLPSNDYLAALTRENVDLVTEPIERITAAGVVTADGTEHPADVLVCSTGFDIAGHITEVDFEGRGGRTNAEVWARRASRPTAGRWSPGSPICCCSRARTRVPARPPRST